MKYYTAKGDKGTTKLFSCPQGVRISKGDSVFEVLGGVDELNSFVGWCHAVAERSSFDGAKRKEFLEALRTLQEDLFIIQAQLGGGTVPLPMSKVARMEATIELFANAFPKIHSFVIPGATELSALLDVSRTIARRVERSYIRGKRERKAAEDTIEPYLNRASSLLYVLARYANHAHGVSECAPAYH